MFLDLVATISAAFALAGVALILRSLSRKRLPGWIVPAAAGFGMLSFAIWNEYTWYPRTVAALPDGVVVARAQENSAPWRPWTYVRPLVTRFSAVDTRMNRTNPDAPGQVLTTVLLVGRWQPGASVPVIFDCEGARRAMLTGDAPLGAEPDWEVLPATDESLRAACDAVPAQG
jgi:hypothetical protein